MLCARVWISAECLYRGLYLSFKAQCLPQIEEGLFVFPGVGVVVKFDVFALLCSLFVLFANKQ